MSSNNGLLFSCLTACRSAAVLLLIARSISNKASESFDGLQRDRRDRLALSAVPSIRFCAAANSLQRSVQTMDLRARG